MTDLLVRGGTVVTASGSRLADVAVAGGRISEVGLGLPVRSAEVVDAVGLLVLPGCVDVHTHTRVATDAEPDRFFQDSAAAAFGGTTSFLAFNNPGTGASAAASRSLVAGLREWQARTAGDAAVDYGLSLVIGGAADDPVGELAAVVEAGVPTAKAFMVFDFRLDDRRLFETLRALGRLGGMLGVHCEDPVVIDAAVADELAAGHLAPRYHAAARPPNAEAVATARVMAFARLADAPVYVVHVSCAEALDHVRHARATGVRAFAETCPHHLALTNDVYANPDPELVARYVVSPPLRSAADRAALWRGLGEGALDVVASDHVPDRLAVEKRVADVPFDRISNGAPGIETMLTMLHTEGVARGRIGLERMVDLAATTPARLFGLARKGSIEVGKDADLVIFDPSAMGAVRAAALHHTSDYTPYEGMPVTGAVRSVYVRGRAVIRDGRFVGGRGFGRFIERESAGRP